MQSRKTKKLYHVVLMFPNEITRNIKIKAASRETAEARALKFHPHAVGVKRDA